MANIKGNALPEAGSISLNDLLIVVNPSTGVAYKTTVGAFLGSSGIGKSTLDIPAKSGATAGEADDITINWQNDLVPGDTRTYAEKHGNSIGAITAVWNDSGAMTFYNPSWSYTMTGSDIDTLTISGLFNGKLTII